MDFVNEYCVVSPSSSVCSSSSDLNCADVSKLSLLPPSNSCQTSQPVKKSRCYRYPWTKEEDCLLIQCVQKFGEKNWKAISDHIAGRTGKQCRQRWLYNLSPDVKKRKWTEEEDIILLEAQRVIGNKWALIRKRLPGRSENDVKNRYHSIMNRLETQRKRDSTVLKRDLQLSYPSSISLPVFSSSVSIEGPNEDYSSDLSSFLYPDLCVNRVFPDFPFDDVIHPIDEPRIDIL